MEEQIFTVLSHKIRRTIIKIIYEKSGASYKDLATLGLEPGTLYFHIKSLTYPLKFIYQNKKTKKYYLTELGYKAYETIINIDSLAYIGKTHSVQENLLSRIFYVLALTKVIKSYTKDNVMIIHILQAAAVMFTIGILAANIQIYPALFVLETQPILPVGGYLIVTMISWLGIALITEGILRCYFKNNQDSSKLILGINIAFLPILFFMSIVYIVDLFIPVAIYLHSHYILPFSILLEIWCLIILSGVIAYVKKTKYQTSLTIALTIGYVNLVIVAIQLSLLK